MAPPTIADSYATSGKKTVAGEHGLSCRIESFLDESKFPGGIPPSLAFGVVCWFVLSGLVRGSNSRLRVYPNEKSTA
jgi:hypothetical protein